MILNYLFNKTSFSYFVTSSNQALPTGTPHLSQYSSHTAPNGRVLISSCIISSSVSLFSSCNDFNVALGVQRAISIAFCQLLIPRRALSGTTPPEFCEIDKAGFSVCDLVSGDDADTLVNGDPLTPWISPERTADIVIDMGRVEKVAGLGHYPRVIWRSLIEDWYGGTPPIISEFPVEYTVSTSLDGEHYNLCDEGIFRCYGSEEIISFESRDARYVRLTIHSNVATYKGIPEFADRGLAIGELTLYK